jgi:ATP-dependent Clp protease ATP-binding subunit ClpC
MSSTALVYKYFDLIDGFIRVKVLDPEAGLPELQNQEGEPPSRREYRRLVIDSCVIALEEEVLPRVHTVYPEDTIAAEDLLYQICIDVNPGLEIHAVSLPAQLDDDGEEQIEQFRRRAKALQDEVLQDVVGQDDAVERICRAVRKSASGIADPERPIGSFLLVGHTGTGKTELAKSLSRHLFENNLVRIDCSEFALPHETAKLIGAPPGYVGHNDGGALTEAMMRNPHAIVLFDEIEKGHEKLHNMLLQILDEGRLTDSKGRTVSFRESLILMTSNVGTADYAEASQRLGFGREGGLEASAFADITEAALARAFKPELRNRLDGVLTFRSLRPEDCSRIVVMQFERLAARLRRHGLSLRWSRRLVEEVALQGYSEEFGARELRRTLVTLIEEPLSMLLLEEGMREGDKLTLGWRAGKLTIRREESKKGGKPREFGADHAA